jgi:hypothetical protein
VDDREEERGIDPAHKDGSSTLPGSLKKPRGSSMDQWIHKCCSSLMVKLEFI